MAQNTPPKTTPEKIDAQIIDRFTDSDYIVSPCICTNPITGATSYGITYIDSKTNQHVFSPLAPRFRNEDGRKLALNEFHTKQEIKTEVFRAVKLYSELPYTTSPADNIDGKLTALAQCLLDTQLLSLAKTDHSQYSLYEEEIILLITSISRFRGSKHVYLFDENTRSELYAANIRNMPLRCFSTLPYPSIFIEAPQLSVSKEKSPAYEGAFLHIDDQDDKRRLIITLVTKPSKTTGFQFQTTELTIPSDEKWTIGDELDLVIKEISVKHPSKIAAHEQTMACVLRILSLAAFIITNENDQNIVYKPMPSSHKKNKKKDRKSSNSTIHVAGRHYGSKIGEWKKIASTANIDPNAGPRSRKAPHIRRGHWHHYWTGPLDNPDERKLIVKWVDWTFVNWNLGEIDIVVHTT